MHTSIYDACIITGHIHCVDGRGCVWLLIRTYLLIYIFICKSVNKYLYVWDCGCAQFHTLCLYMYVYVYCV